MPPRFRFHPAALLAIPALLACARPALADGGRLRFRQPAGPFTVTLFTTPDPLTAGRADFSVAVERPGVSGILQDARIRLTLTPVGTHARPIVLDASHAAATSKWLQAANFSLPAAGLWRVTVLVRSGNQSGHCSADLRVRPAGTPNLLWDILPVPLAALFLGLHQLRKRQYRRDRQRRLAPSESPAEAHQRPGDAEKLARGEAQRNPGNAA